VNAERRAQKLPALRASTALADAGRLHARDMAEVGYVEHDSFDRLAGQLVRSCTWPKRVLAFVPGRDHVAENIAAGATTPQEVVEGWMKSPEHRRNVLGEALVEVGVGYWAGGDDGFYWVADFAGDP
jgi:uncharacterized protein YkwD